MQRYELHNKTDHINNHRHYSNLSYRYIDHFRHHIAIYSHPQHPQKYIFKISNHVILIVEITIKT